MKIQFGTGENESVANEQNANAIFPSDRADLVGWAGHKWREKITITFTKNAHSHSMNMLLSRIMSVRATFEDAEAELQ